MRPTDDLVREFHSTPGSSQGIKNYPTIPTKDLVRHRMRLIIEEHEEVLVELKALLAGNLTQDQALEIMGKLLKELCDVRYVADGTCIEMGLDYEGAYRAVHESNMTKVFPDGTFHTNENGKVLKGPNYRPPDMTKFVPPIIEGEVEE